MFSPELDEEESIKTRGDKGGKLEPRWRGSLDGGEVWTQVDANLGHV
jgi:hypothetical protein